MRYRVKRARDPYDSNGYAMGWFVIDALGNRLWFATWAEAWRYALDLARFVNAEAVSA